MNTNSLFNKKDSLNVVPPKITHHQQQEIPLSKITQLRSDWMQLYTPIVVNLKLDIRVNLKQKQIELRTNEHTEDVGCIQKASDFLNAYFLGFKIDDAITLLRIEDMYVDKFDVLEVKTLKGEHLSRAIGRIAGRGGRVKVAIEHNTKTRIVLKDTKVNILGSYLNIQIAKRAICNLIMGSQPGKVHNSLRGISNRLNERL